MIAKTVKGKGISFMENQSKWHHNRLSEEQFDLAMSELDGESIK
jgi:transketolase